MKGYIVPFGYMGWTGRGYSLIATETEYIEYMSEIMDR